MAGSIAITMKPSTASAHSLRDPQAIPHQTRNQTHWSVLAGFESPLPPAESQIDSTGRKLVWRRCRQLDLLKAGLWLLATFGAASPRLQPYYFMGIKSDSDPSLYYFRMSLCGGGLG